MHTGISKIVGVDVNVGVGSSGYCDGKLPSP